MASSDCIIDSSVFIAFYRDGDSQHEKAVRVITDLAGRTLIVHPYVIQETVTALCRKHSYELAKQFLSDVVSGANTIIPHVYIRADIDAFLEAKKRMAFTDIALISFAKQASAELITFDEQMLNLLH